MMQREKTIGEWWIRGQKAFYDTKMLQIIYLAKTANSAQISARLTGFNWTEGKIIHSAMRLILGSNQNNAFDGTHPDFDFKEHNLRWLSPGFEEVIIDGVKRFKPNKKNIILLSIFNENNQLNLKAQESEKKKEGE